MKKERTFYLYLGFAALFIFGLTCIRPIRALGFPTDFWPYLYDGTLQHKIGELFLWIPFYYIGLNTYSKSKAALTGMIHAYRWPMFLGGVLNLVSWFSLKDEVIWHPFCWLVFFWGVFAVPLCKWLFLPRANTTV